VNVWVIQSLQHCFNTHEWDFILDFPDQPLLDEFRQKVKAIEYEYQGNCSYSVISLPYSMNNMTFLWLNYLIIGSAKAKSTQEQTVPVIKDNEWRDAWNVNYIDLNGVVPAYLYHIHDGYNRWKGPHKVLAPYTALVNASMTGTCTILININHCSQRSSFVGLTCLVIYVGRKNTINE
jgi:hypothetical protein